MPFDSIDLHRNEDPRQLLFLELNEVNFEQVEHYVAQGRLPAFARFFDQHGYQTTTSEQSYEHLEPWIQWVTAHTGLSFAEHGVFRLGDIVDRDIPQIWEALEQRGYSVGAISPMNAKCRVANPAFFIPDPWTRTKVVGPGVLRRLYDAVAEAVNENASGRTTVEALINLAIGGLTYARPGNWFRYAGLLTRSRRKSWSRALFLDLLLTDVFIKSVKSRQPHFATLFLNAAAHIQHHYMYSSSAYDGRFCNPDWYVKPGDDPLFDVFELYDRALADVQSEFPDARIMIATGLHQDPHDALTFYWRLKAHDSFLNAVGVTFQRVEPRMSRDFLVVCEDASKALDAQAKLEAVRTADDQPLFDVDNRGADLFVTLTWAEDVAESMSFTVNGRPMGALKPHLAFVAIKNGQHNGVGYFADSQVRGSRSAGSFPLTEIPKRVLAAFENAT